MSGKGYWEWWSANNNLMGCFDTREQLIEAVAAYMAMHGWEAGKWVLREIAGWVESDGERDEAILGPELFREALTYG